MGIDLEDELRQAYSQLPQSSTDRKGMIERTRRRADATRRRRAVGIGAGAAVAAIAVAAAAIAGSSLAAGQQKDILLPAGGSAKTSTRAITTSGTSEHPHNVPSVPLSPDEGSDKPVAGLSGRLLPHGNQLPDALAYRGAYVADSSKSWRTSPADGTELGAMPVMVLIVSSQGAGAATPSQTRAAYGIEASVSAAAKTSEPDTSQSFRAVETAIVRFRTPQLAHTAIAKARRHEGGLRWTDPELTSPNIAWAGVPGVTGDHAVYDFPAGAPQPVIVAYQIVGQFIVSANGTSAALAEQAVVDTVRNLKDTGLLK